jgi:hypothetical protein
MFGIVADIISILSLSVLVMYFMDYVFGTDKLRFITDWLNRHSIYYAAVLWGFVGVAFKVSGVIFDADTLYDLGTFYVLAVVFIVTGCHVCSFIFKAITNLRAANIQQRKKPR